MSQFSLLKDRRFWPLFTAQFTSAFNDNLFKTALSVLVAYNAWTTGVLSPTVVVSMTMGLLILPFVIFAPLAGDLADKYDKAVILRRLKFVEVFIIGAAAVALFAGSIPFALLVLLAFGTQAAFFSPGKYSILPQHLEEGELIGGNALLNTGTYIAILAGMMMGGLFALSGVGRFALALALAASGAGGYLAAKNIPSAPPGSPDLKIRFNIVTEIVKLISYARSQRADVFRAIIGCSWFYFVGATVLAQFPNFTRYVLDGDTFILTFFMVLFSIGISIGGLLNEKILRARVEAKYAPAAALFMALFLFDIYLLSGNYAHGEGRYDRQAFILMSFSGCRVMFDLLGLSIAGGIFVVPLKSIIQHRTSPERRARVMAAGSMIDSLFILSSSIICSGLLSLHFSIQSLFLMTAAGSVAAAFYLKGFKKS